MISEIDIKDWIVKQDIHKLRSDLDEVAQTRWEDKDAYLAYLRLEKFFNYLEEERIKYVKKTAALLR